MVRKLLAVMFAATLMAGTALGAEVGYVWHEGAWKALDGTGKDAPGGALEIEASNPVSIANTADAEAEPLSVVVGAVTLTGATGLTIGDTTADFEVESEAVATPGRISLTADSLTANAGGATTVNIKAGNTLNVLGAVTLSNESGELTTLTNEGTLVMGSLAEVTDAKIVNTDGNLTLANGAGSESLAAAIVNGAATTIGTVTLGNGVTAFDLNSLSVSAGEVTINAQTANVAGNIMVGAAALNLLGGTFEGSNITATGGITTAANSTVGFANTFSATTVGSGGTLRIVSGGTATADGDITMGAGGTLHLDAALAMDSNVLDMSSTGKLTVGSGVTAGDIITGFDDHAEFKIDGEAAADADAVNAYLGKFGTIGLTRTTGFEFDTDKIAYTSTATTGSSSSAMATVLNNNDSAHMAPGLTASATDAWKAIITEHTEGTAYTGQGGITATLMDDYFNKGAASGSAEMQSVVSTLAGFDSAKSLDIAMITANNVAGRVQSRVADNNLARARADEIVGSGGALASTILNNSFANRFWMGGFGLWEDADQRGWDNGYKYNSGGFITGYDRVFGALTVGGSFAYTAGSYEDKNALASDSDIDSYAFTLYGTYNHCSGFFATLLGGYTYSDYDMSNLLTKAGQWDKSDFHANTWTIGGSVGYDFRLAQRLTVTPSIGLYHYTSSTNRFNTTIRNGMKVEQDSTELPIDVAVNYDIPTASGNVRLTANTGYAYSFGKDGGELGDFGYNGIAGSRVSGIEGRENARHMWNIGAGATYSTGRFDIGMKYDYYTKSDYDAHRLMGTVGISF